MEVLNKLRERVQVHEAELARYRLARMELNVMLIDGIIIGLRQAIRIVEGK